MVRPRNCRKICFNPAVRYFKPQGIPLKDIDVVLLSMDEMEALRLVDFLELYQEEAAGRMGISRQTFGRTLALARKKIADALIQGKALKIEQNAVEDSLNILSNISKGEENENSHTNAKQ